MIAKLVAFIAALVAFAFFAGFNLDNRSNIWLFLKTYENVPVFMNTLISFAFGVLCTLPLAMVRRIKKQKKLEEEAEDIKKTKKRGKIKSEPPLVTEENSGNNNEIKY